MDLLIIQPLHWHAMIRIDPDGAEYPSPIWVDEVRPMKSSLNLLKLSYYHAQYPDGVRDKKVELKIIEHQSDYVLALEQEQEQESDLARTVIIKLISREWITRHFPGMKHKLLKVKRSWQNGSI